MVALEHTCKLSLQSDYFFLSPLSGSGLHDKDDETLSTEAGQNHTFFRRSDSMTFLGCIPPNPFEVSLAEAIPLADQPHLLQVIISDTYKFPAIVVKLVVEGA